MVHVIRVVAIQCLSIRPQQRSQTKKKKRSKEGQSKGMVPGSHAYGVNMSRDLFIHCNGSVFMFRRASSPGHRQATSATHLHQGISKCYTETY